MNMMETKSEPRMEFTSATDPKLSPRDQKNEPRMRPVRVERMSRVVLYGGLRQYDLKYRSASCLYCVRRLHSVFAMFVLQVSQHTWLE